MKTIMTSVALFLLLNMQAQVTNSAQSRDSLSVDAMANGLAKIAMENNSINKADEAIVKAAEHTYKAQKYAWLDVFKASFNVNEYTIGKTVGADDPLDGRAYYPRYNFGLNVPFGIFTTQPNQTKALYYRYQADMENLKVAKQNIGLQTMTMYYDYVRTQRLYELQEEALQDASFASTKTEEKFSKGEVTLDVYTATSRRYNAERAAKVTLERDLMVNKAQLETLLGMPLEAALQQVRTGRRAGGSGR